MIIISRFFSQCIKRVKAIWHEFVISSKWQQIWLQHNSNSGNNNNKDDGSYRAAIWGLTDGGAWHEAGDIYVCCAAKRVTLMCQWGR